MILIEYKVLNWNVRYLGHHCRFYKYNLVPALAQCNFRLIKKR
jgi:hypothetical protein